MEPIESPTDVADLSREIASEDAALQRYVQSFAPPSTEAQDVVQETWLAALEGEAPRLWRNPQAWLRVVARRIVHRERARRALRTKSEHAAALGARERSARESLELEREAALQAVAELEDPYRTVIRLRFFEELSTEEIAQELGRSPATVRSQIHRGIALVRAQMSPRQRAERRWLFLGWLRRAKEGEPVLSPALRALAAVALVVSTLWLGLRLVDETPRAPSGELVVAAGLDTPVRSDRAPSPDAGAPAPRTSTAKREAFVAVAPIPAPLSSDDAIAHAPALEIEVVDPRGNPVGGALVSVVLRTSSMERGTSDEQGRCRIQLSAADAGAYVLPATLGRVTLQASSPAHAASSLVHVPLELCDGRTLELALGGPPLALAFRVIDEAGRPVPGAHVSCGGAGGFIPPAGDIFESPWLPETRTDEDGAFLISGLAREPQFVRVFADGFLELRERIAPPPTYTERVDGTLVLRRGATLSGSVFGSDGRPAANALVFAEPLTRPTEWSARLSGYDERLLGFAAQAVTDACGRFELSGIRPGKRRLWAMDANDVATAVLAVDSLQPSTWEARLAPPVGLALRLLDEHGAPRAGLRLRVRSGAEPEPHEWMRSATTDEQGRVRIADCLDGPASVDVLDERNVELLARATDLHPGLEEHVIVVRERASAAGVVRGFLLGHDGLAFPSASLKRYDPETQTAIALSLDRSSGRFEQTFPPGRFLLACVVDRRGFSFGEHVLEAGETLDLGVLRTPPTGTLVPLAGAALPLAVQPEIFRLSVRYPTRGPSIFRELLRGSWPPPEELELFPGTHWIEAIDDATGVVFRGEAEITPGGTALMDLP